MATTHFGFPAFAVRARAELVLMFQPACIERNRHAAQQWTSVHSFYAGMGGFVFDMTVPEMSEGPTFIPEVRRLHITPRGLQLLAGCGLLPAISRDDIEDKSKAEWSGKFLCCVQVTWFMVQAVVRLAAGLTIAPLEINTIGHIVCALLIYALWWYKPKWVNQPTVLRGDWTRAMCAFMYMSSQISAEQHTQRVFLRNFGVKTELAGVLYISSCDVEKQQMTNNPLTNIVDTSNNAESAVQTCDISPVKGVRPKSCRVLARTVPRDAESAEPRSAALQAMRQRRWDYAQEAIEHYPAIQNRLRFPERNAEQMRYRDALQLYPQMPRNFQRRFEGYSEEDGFGPAREAGTYVCTSEELVVERPRNWPGDDLIVHMEGHLMGMIMWCSSTIYGAIHLAGWHEIFPTTIEQWFWRGSAAYIIFSGLLWSFLNLCGQLSGAVWLYWYNLLAGNVCRKGRTLIYILGCVGGTLYVAARTYLVVEAFISLRALPASAYLSPSWILTVPHIG
ncbi:hypothetical protein LTR49_026689 [Elasticomyces elasticus]|nr:hypothetical protein LTR49_026689 [Elasticomyces elasticus]